MVTSRHLTAALLVLLAGLTGCFGTGQEEDGSQEYPESWWIYFEPDPDVPRGAWGGDLYVRFRVDDSFQHAEAGRWYKGRQFGMVPGDSVGMACDDIGIDARFRLFEDPQGDYNIDDSRHYEDEDAFARAYWQGIRCGDDTDLVIHADGTMELLHRETREPVEPLPMADATQ